MRALLTDVHNIMLEGDIPFNTTGFNEIQKKEEAEKIQWRQINKPLIETLGELEDHYLLQGTVAIVGLDAPEKFTMRAENFKGLFNGKINYLTISMALLTIADYSQLASWRFMFGNGNDSTWRELFTQSQQRKNFERTRAALLNLLDSIQLDFNNHLSKRIEDYLMNPATPKDWKYYFIKYPKMRMGNSGIYWWRKDPSREKKNPYEIIMMNTPFSLNGKHWNPFLCVIYHDKDFSGELTLKDYDDPLIINHSDRRIRCVNSSWDIYDGSNNLIKSLHIPQTNGVDEVDRIEFLKEQFNSISSL